MTQLLWPEGRLTRAGRIPRRQVRSGRYVVIPSASRPKLVVPRRPLRVAAAAIRNYNTGAPWRTRLAVTTLAAGVRLGLAELLPTRLDDGRCDGAVVGDIRTYLSDVLGSEFDVGLYIGPARAVRKPVVQVLDARGKTVAFAKLGVDEFTRGLVCAEARAVQFLHDVKLSVLEIPEVLHHGVWNSHHVLVQSAIARGASARSGDVLLGRAMDELARVGGTEAAVLATSRYRHQLRQRLTDLPADDQVRALARALDEACRRYPQTALEFGHWHGDWAPWNMTVASGRVRVWDWEKFEAGKPVGFDAVHYAVQAATVLGGATPRDAFAATLNNSALLLQAHDVEVDVAPLIVWLYVIDLALRYLEDAETQAGSTPMSRLSQWLNPVLADLEQCAHGQQ